MDINADYKKYEKVAEKLKAMAHPQRLCILNGLSNKKCNVSNMVDCMGLPQSTVSQHLARLKSAGLISGNRKGLEVCYELSDDLTKELLEIINNYAD